MGIQKKILIAILITGFIALIVGLPVTYYEVKDVLTEVIGRDFAEIAKKTAERFDAAIKKEVATFNYLAADPSFIRAVKVNRSNEVESYLIRYLSLPEELEVHLGLLVVNDKGRIIGGSRRYSDDQSGEEWWRITFNHDKGKVFASDIYVDSLTGKRAFDIGIPIKDKVTGKIVGGIRSIMNVDDYFNFIADMSFATTGHVMIINSGGTPLLCPVLPPEKHLVSRSLIEMIVEKGAGWSIAADDAHGGKNSVVGFSPLRYVNSLGPENLGGYKWYTFIRQDPAETFAPVKRLMLMLLIVDFSIVLLICALGVYFVRRLVLNPVDIIHSGVDHIERGNLDYRINISTGDELESLADGFNKMGTSLKDLYHNLETKIQERTSELEKTKNYLESILRHSTDMIITTDLNGRVVTFNEGAERILGYKQCEVIGTLMSDYYHNKDDRQKLIMIISDKKMVTNYETELLRKDGEVIDISLSLSELRDENGEVIGTVGISKDITQWKKAQLQLKEYSLELETMVEKRTMEVREGKTHLEAMLVGIAEGVVFVDNENKITLINDAAETIFGIKREDWYGKYFKNAHSEKAHEKALQLIMEMREGKLKSYSSEIKAGEKTVLAHFSPIMHGQEYLGVIFIATDVTELKRLQTELVQSEKLALVGKMSSAVAHELRNPLVPIGGFANLIYKRLEDESPLKKYAGIIVREIDRLEKLLHNILYFTKDTRPEFKPVNLNEIINELLFFYKDTFEEHNINLSISLSPDMLIVNLDHSLMKQALINIIINAIQSMENGGLLTVETMTKMEKDKLSAVVVINDTGAGIPEDIMNSIFDPFYTTKIRGLGLGLSLTRRIVESHGGEIKVESAEGIGSTFIISLPAS